MALRCSSRWLRALETHRTIATEGMAWKIFCTGVSPITSSSRSDRITFLCHPTHRTECNPGAQLVSAARKVGRLSLNSSFHGSKIIPSQKAEGQLVTLRNTKLFVLRNTRTLKWYFRTHSKHAQSGVTLGLRGNDPSPSPVRITQPGNVYTLSGQDIGRVKVDRGPDPQPSASCRRAA
jgi:hypothetical protein